MKTRVGPFDVGDDDCEFYGVNIIHACKEPCFVRAKKETAEEGNAIVLPRGVYLNMVDADSPKYFNVGLFKVAQEFMDHRANTLPRVLVHCNMGGSRSPSLVLVWMARHGLIPNASYPAAASAFQTEYPAFGPGLGIEAFMRNEWSNLIAI